MQVRNVVVQVMSFTYVRVPIFCKPNIVKKVQKLTLEALRIFGSLRDIFWGIGNMAAENKVKIYTKIMSQVRIHACETREETWSQLA